MSEKDFLSQFSEINKKPESFKEEVRVKVQKPKKPVNKLAIIIALAVLVIAAIVSYFVFFAPKIEMPNFVGKTKTDVAAFVKQQGIETTGIIFEEEYDFDSDEGTILSQSIEAGKKVKEDVKITFKASLGADPDELIEVPDFESMDKTEIKEWIDEEKLTKTKVSTTYSEAVDEDQVISYAFSGCDEDSFTRNSTLKIVISKGPAPAGTVTLEDFTKKSYEYVETWATSKKVELTKTETYSDTIDKGLVISQSIASGKTMKEGETLTVSVSLGKGIVLPDFTAMSKNEVETWLDTNKSFSVSINKSLYSDSDSYIIEQSVKAGKKISVSDTVYLTKNLGDGFYLSEEGVDLTGSYDRLKDWASAAEAKGICAEVHKNYVNSSEVKGTILSYEIVSGSKTYSNIQKLPLEVYIYCTVSSGQEDTPSTTTATVGNYIGMSEDAARTAILDKGFNFACSKLYNENEVGKVYEQSESAGTEVLVDSYIEVKVSLGKCFKITDLIDENEIVGNTFAGVYELVSQDRIGSEQFEFIAKPGDTETVTKDAIVKDFGFVYETSNCSIKAEDKENYHAKNHEVTISDTDLKTLKNGGKITVTLVLYSVDPE